MFVIVNSLNLGEPYKVNVKNILSSLDFNSEGAYSSEMTSPQKIFSAYLHLLILIGQLMLEKKRVKVVRFISVLFKILKKCFLLHNFSVRRLFIFKCGYNLESWATSPPRKEYLQHIVICQIVIRVCFIKLVRGIPISPSLLKAL